MHHPPPHKDFLRMHTCMPMLRMGISVSNVSIKRDGVIWWCCHHRIHSLSWPSTASLAIKQSWLSLSCLLSFSVGLQWRQSSNHRWHKALELHCAGTEGAPIHLSVMNNGWRGEVRMMNFVNSHSALLTPLEGSTCTALRLFLTWPSEETVMTCFLR